MAVVAGRNPRTSFSEQEIATCLQSRAGSRLALALLDIDARLQDMRARYVECERDSAVRLQNNATLTKMIEEAQAERASHVRQIQTLTEWLQQAQADDNAASHKLEIPFIADPDSSRPATLSRLRAVVSAQENYWPAFAAAAWFG